MADSFRTYPPMVNILRGAKEPAQNLEIGPWHCRSDNPDQDLGFEMLEVHTAYEGDGVVFRVTQFNRLRGEIKLNPCAVLNKAEAIAVRDRLNAIIENLSEPEGE